MPTQQQLLHLISSLNAYLTGTAKRMSDASERMQRGLLLSADELNRLMQHISDYGKQRQRTLQQLQSFCPGSDSPECSVEDLTAAVNRFFHREGYLKQICALATNDDGFAPKLAALQADAAKRLPAADAEELEAYQIFLSLAEEPTRVIADEKLELLGRYFPVVCLRALFQGALYCAPEQTSDTPAPDSNPLEVPSSDTVSAPVEAMPELCLECPDQIALTADGRYRWEDLSIPSVGSFRSTHFNQLIKRTPATRQILTLVARLLVVTREQLVQFLPNVGMRSLDDGLTALVNSGYLEKMRFYAGTDEYIFYVLAKYCINRAGQETIRRQLAPEFEFKSAQNALNTLSGSLLSYERIQWCGDFARHAYQQSNEISYHITGDPRNLWPYAEITYQKTHFFYFPMRFNGSQIDSMMDAAANLFRGRGRNDRIVFALSSPVDARYWEMELRRAGAPTDCVLFWDQTQHQLYTSDFRQTSIAALCGFSAPEVEEIEPEAEPAAAAPVVETEPLAEPAPSEPEQPQLEIRPEPPEEAHNDTESESDPSVLPDPVRSEVSPDEPQSDDSRQETKPIPGPEESQPASETTVPEPVSLPEDAQPASADVSDEPQPENDDAPDAPEPDDPGPAPGTPEPEDSEPDIPEPEPEDSASMPDTPEPESEQSEADEAPLPPAEPIVIDAENSIFPIQPPEEFALLPTALGYFGDGRMECGMLMLRSACRLDRASYQLPCRRFAYALDDPLERCTYDYGLLQELYSPNGSEAEPFSCKVLAFCACLRMLFSEDLRGLAGYEYLIREPNLSSLFEDTLYELVPELRSVIYDLCTIFETFHRGFDASLIGMTQKAADSGEQLQEIQDTARSLLDARLERTTTSNGRLLSLRAKLFGPSGELMSLLKAVLDNDTTRLDEVKRFCARFLRPGTSHPNSDRFDPRALKHYVDTTYETVEGYNHDAIIGGGFSSIITNLNKILNILTRWIDLNRDGQITDEASLELIRRIGTRLSEHLSSADQTLQALQPDELFDRAAVSCLRQTLQEMNLRIQGKFRVPEEFYLDFLSGDQIELNPETGLPELEESVSIIPGYELWRRVYNHANNPRPLSSIPEQIYPADGSCTFDFGRAVLYQRYLEAHQLPQAVSADRIEQDRPSAQKMLSVWIKSFESRLELIDSYGRLEIGRKDRILLEIEQSYLPHAQKTGNFGFFRRATQAYLQAADLASLKLRDEVSLELRQLEETQGALPITQTIRALIEAGKYSVASDYIRLAVNEGYQQAPADGMLLESASKDHLADFIGSYNRLFDQYFAPNTLFERIYSEQYPPAQDHNRQLRSARLFVNSWPKGNTALGDTAELLTQLGFSPASVKEVGPLAREVTIQPSSMRLSEYAHPIAAFGTRLSKTGLQVNYLLGRFNCASLMDHLRSFGRNERPLLVILDYALTLPERRELARAFKHEGANLRTMLLIDRVLAAYLTQFNISERALALLQCTLPFHYCNPYFENPQSIIPPEMFMGRRQELNAILENGRCNIIYGGRQLGKTALLHRARYLADDHENGSWSLYVDLKPDDKDSAAAHICRELKRADFGFLPEQTECTDWQSLSDAIRARMNDPARPVSRLLLLLDEADRFLNSSASDSYRAVEILSALQTQTEDRFKFVLAGLHNVQRFQARATEHNSKLAHLHSMAIKPLSYADASQLLEMPLFYLGFRMKPNQTALISQVLSSCNYYPGLIHFYCSRLISRLSERSGGTRSVHSEPPYYLDDDQIRMLIQDKTFNEQIHEKFFITLQVDEQDYYKILSYALAYCYMDNQKNAALGFTAGDVLEICEAFNITSVTNLPRSSVEALMRELEELNILRSISDGRYSFNRRSFRNMLGDENTVWAALEQYGEVPS